MPPPRADYGVSITRSPQLRSRLVAACDRRRTRAAFSSTAAVDNFVDNLAPPLRIVSVGATPVRLLKKRAGINCLKSTGCFDSSKPSRASRHFGPALARLWSCRAAPALALRMTDDLFTSSRSSAWSVAGLIASVAEVVQFGFPACTVRGEVSGFSRPASGHCYFNLKDPDGSATLRCAMFRRAAQLMAFQPRDGDAVELRGRLAVYEPRGELQLVVESMQKSGAGALYERFLRLRSKLEAEGLFDAAMKRPFGAISLRHRSRDIVNRRGAARRRHDVGTARASRPGHRLPELGARQCEAPAALCSAIALAACTPRGRPARGLSWWWIAGGSVGLQRRDCRARHPLGADAGGERRRSRDRRDARRSGRGPACSDANRRRGDRGAIDSGSARGSRGP